jgi:hypothetical protein
MPDTAEVVGGDLVVTHDGSTFRLSLAVPLEALDVWLAASVEMPWREYHNMLRDQVMPTSAREQVVALEATDAAFAIELVRGWANALNDRLGKALFSAPFGAESAQPSPPTSGSDTASEPTESELPAPTRSPRRTRSRS